MSDALWDDLLVRVKARLHASARSSLSFPRARLNSSFWFALHHMEVPDDAPSVVVVPLDVFMTLRNAFPNSFTSILVPSTQDPVTPLSVLYPVSKKTALTLATASKQEEEEEEEEREASPKEAKTDEEKRALLEAALKVEMAFDELKLGEAEYNSLEAIRTALHALQGLDVATSKLSVSAKKIWDSPTMWDVLPWTGEADAFSVDDCCVFKLVDSAPPHVPTAEELAAQAEEKKRRQEHEFPTLSEILREDEWAEVVKLCRDMESASSSQSFARLPSRSTPAEESKAPDEESELGDAKPV